MAKNAHQTLSRRERQIMDVIYRLGRATANEVIRELPEERHSSTVRTQLRVLEEKGHLHHEEEGLRYVYSPVMPRSAARQTALRHVIETFFEGSAEKMMSSLLGGRTRLSEDELDRLSAMISEARRGKREKRE
jgi:predicted transcriptional regulator